MISNPSFHLNKFIKWATWCWCPWDGIFFIKITSCIPSLSNLQWANLWFWSNRFLTRWLKLQDKIYSDWVYWLRLNDWYVALESLSNCPQAFVSNNFLTEFVFNTADCKELADWFYWIKVLWCNANYAKILDDWNCWISTPTWLSTNSYTCWDALISWSPVEEASSYTISYNSQWLWRSLSHYFNFQGNDTNSLIHNRSENSLFETYSSPWILTTWKVSTWTSLPWFSWLVWTTWQVNLWNIWIDNKSFSISWWIKPDSSTVSNYFLIGWTWHINDKFLHVWARWNWAWTFAFYWDDLDWWTVVPWQRTHYVATYDNTTRTQRLYINWIKVWERTSSIYTWSWDYFMWWMIDEIGIWKWRAITQEEINKLYLNGYSYVPYTETKTITTSSNELIIPYESVATTNISLVANGIAWSSLPATTSLSMNQCAITWLSSNWYIHWALNLTWNSNDSATYYTVIYWSTTTTTTTPNITIPYTSSWNVVYQVKSCNPSWCSIASSIIVNMMQSNVTWITSNSYWCWDLTLSWNAISWADRYWISYNWNNVYTTNASTIISYTSPWSVTYTIRAWNDNGYNTWSTISVTMNSCGVWNLSSNWYTCWDLTLSWSSVSSATNYDISYSWNIINTTSTSRTISYTSPWNVIYTIIAKNWSTVLSSASIEVNMTNCITYQWNVYSRDSSTFYVTTNNNPSSMYWNTTILDDRTQVWEVNWFSWSFNPTWIKQNPYTKKIHYKVWTSIYVWNVGEKQVSLVVDWDYTPYYTNIWVTYWYKNVVWNEDWRLMYSWNDFSIWTTSFQIPYSWLSSKPTPSIECSNDWSRIAFVYFTWMAITNNSWSVIRRIDPYSLWWTWEIFWWHIWWDSNSSCFIVTSIQNWSFYIHTLLWKINDSVTYNFADERVQQMKVYNNKVYYTKYAWWNSNSVFNFFSTWETSTTNNPTTLAKPNWYDYVWVITISTGVNQNWFQTWLYHSILETSGDKNIYASYPCNIDISSAADWFIALAVATWYNTWWSTWYWPDAGALIKASLSLWYLGERTTISLTNNVLGAWYIWSSYWYRFRN